MPALEDQIVKYTVSGVSHPGKVRSINQDNFYCEGCYRGLEHEELGVEGKVRDGRAWIAAVFDGMGGEKDGEIASLLAARITKAVCAKPSPSYDIARLIEYINREVCREMEERMCNMGSTCVFLEFEDSRCRSWNIGDSRSYHFHDGNLTQLSEDHTEATSLQGLIKEGGGRPGSENLLTQHLGIPDDEFIIEPYVSEWLTIEPGDFLLLCSDGLSHLAGDDEVRAVLASSASLQEKRENLLDLALDHGGSDNITILVIDAHV